MRSKHSLTFIWVTIMLFISCKKDNSVSTNDFFPAKVVNFTIDLSFAQYASLKPFQGYAYIDNVGYRGVVIYHTTDDQYLAYDRTCPVNTEQPCAYVSIDSVSTRFRCGKPGANGWEKCCNSVYDATYNTAISGEARRGLKQYYTALSGNVLTVSSSPL